MAKQYLLHRVGHFGDNESVEGRILLFAFSADALCLPPVELLLDIRNKEIAGCPYRPNDKGCGKKPRLRISTDKGCDDQHCDNKYRNAGP